MQCFFSRCDNHVKKEYWDGDDHHRNEEDHGIKSPNFSEQLHGAKIESKVESAGRLARESSRKEFIFYMAEIII